MLVKYLVFTNSTTFVPRSTYYGSRKSTVLVSIDQIDILNIAYLFLKEF